MAAPSATARQSPTGKRLENGFPVKITFSARPAINLFEVSVTPGGVDNGAPVDIATQWDTSRRPKAPRGLSEFTDGAFTAGYDPAVWSDILAIVGIPQTITYRYADGSTKAEYGWLRSASEGEMSDGSMPTMTGAIAHSAWDTASDVVADPTIVSVAGT